jgi:pimeloyl-ACP methyl ester carboxylesterase
VDVRVDGATLYVETAGDGAPCLCLHGGPGSDSSGLVASLAPLAAPLGVRMVFWDHRGHGRSEWVPPGQCTQDRLVADVEAVRRALGLGRVRVLGISWGGFTTTRYRVAVRDFIVRHEYPAYDCRAELTRVACPTWVAVGRHDWICPVDQAEEIHTLIPHSTLTVFERSGHSLQVEERDAFTRELTAFFAGLAADGVA